MGSNCAPCVEYHIPESQRAGLADMEIREAIEYADKIRQVPARKVFEAALKLLPATFISTDNAGNVSACGCSDQALKAARNTTEKPTPCAATSGEGKCC
jgi:4-carboxymuconolactone decarboxylase